VCVFVLRARMQALRPEVEFRVQPAYYELAPKLWAAINQGINTGHSACCRLVQLCAAACVAGRAAGGVVVDVASHQRAHTRTHARAHTLHNTHKHPTAHARAARNRRAPAAHAAATASNLYGPYLLHLVDYAAVDKLIEEDYGHGDGAYTIYLLNPPTHVPYAYAYPNGA
jgi:hypothetical protein